MKTFKLNHLFYSSSARALLALGVATAAFAASPALANCTVNGSVASGQIVDFVPSGGQVVCDPGTRVQSFDGRTDIQNATPANGFDARIRAGATLVAPGPGGTANSQNNFSALFFGPGSTAIVEQAGEIRGPGGGPGLVVFTGPGSSMTNDGTLVVDGNRPVIQGALSGAVPATGLTLINRGKITNTDASPDFDQQTSDLTGSAAVSLAAGSVILNEGSIQRSSAAGFAVTLRENSRLTNNGSIAFVFSGFPSYAPSPNTSVQSAVRSAGANVEIVNNGVISVGGGRGEAINIAQGDGSTIENGIKGAILARNGTRAIRADGDNIRITNSGRIQGPSPGEAIAINGENFRLIQEATSDLSGDVDVQVNRGVLKTLTEFLAANPGVPPQQATALYNQRCVAGTSLVPCLKFVNARPLQATAEWRTDASVTVDPNRTRFSGVNTFVLGGTGALTLKQDFAAANDPSTSNGTTGDFAGRLTFSPLDASGRITVSGEISNAADGTKGSLRKTGDGTLTLTGTSAYSGGTTIEAGTLQLGNGGASGSIAGDVVNDGTLRFNRDNVLTFGGKITGSGNVVQAGSGVSILTRANTYTGGTEIRAGKLQLARFGSIVGDVVNQGTFVFNTAPGYAFGGAISGTGAVEKQGPGDLTLTGNSTYSGTTIIKGGELRLNGTLQSPRVTVGSGTTLSGSGATTGDVLVRPGGTVAPGGTTPGGQLTVGALDLLAGGVLRIDAAESSGGGLSADRLNVTGTATFGETTAGAGAPYGPTLLDVTFDADAKIPALEGITVVAADGGLKGRAPNVLLDAASLPRGYNFHLDLEATNLGGTFAKPGEIIPTGAGGAGFVVLQVKNADPNYLNPPQITIINAPHLVPAGQPVLVPPQAPYLVPTATPGAIPVLAPALIKGPTANVTTPVTAAGSQTGIKVKKHGIQVGGTLTPQPQTLTGTQTTPTSIPVGTVNSVVVVEPPTDLGTPDFVSISGSYGKVNQTYAQTGTKYALLYQPHQVQVAKIPENHGNLKPLGVTQTKTQQQVGQAVTSILPKPHERPTTTNQANLVSGLYPLTLGEINDALDSIAGTDEDPTFVTVLNTREFQDSMESRLSDHRDGTTDLSGGAQIATDRGVWGDILGVYADGDYLNGSEIRTWGLVLGADQTVAENLVAGVALSYADAFIDTDSGSKDEVSTLEGAIYGSWTLGPWFVYGNIGGSYNWLEMDRAVTVGSYGDTVSGDTNATSFFAGVEAGQSIPVSWGKLEPTVGLRYQYVDRDGYTEDGPDTIAREVSGETLNTGRGILGLRAVGNFRGTGDVLWRPTIRAAYARELGDSDINGTASLLSGTGSTFELFTAGPGEDVGILGVQLEGKGKRTNYFVDYQAEVREGLFSNQFRVGFSMTF